MRISTMAIIETVCEPYRMIDYW